MSSGTAGEIVALVTHARDVPADERERFAARLHGVPAAPLVVLETCHRVEAYLVPGGDDGPSVGWLPVGGNVHVGGAAVRHAISVAVGLDSVVVGEDQILHQLRQSVDVAREQGRLDPVLERLFALATRAGRRARSWRVGPGRSLADVALAMAMRQAGPVHGQEVLVVGAGRMGNLAVRAATAAGASVAVANRSPGPVNATVAATGARPEAFDPGPEIDRFAVVVVALGGPWVIAPATARALAASATVVVDLSVPAALEPSLAVDLGPRLITADALAHADAGPAAAGDPVSVRMHDLIHATAAEFDAWLEAREGRAAAQALATRAEHERQAEMDELWRVLPALDAETRDAIERMSRHLARRLLRDPLERLWRDVDGRHERAARELFGL